MYSHNKVKACSYLLSDRHYKYFISLKKRKVSLHFMIKEPKTYPLYFPKVTPLDWANHPSLFFCVLFFSNFFLFWAFSFYSLISFCH